MSDAVWFGVVFVGFFALRAVATTWVFLYLLPRGDRCPNCDAVTIAIQSRTWNRILPWFRTSWCYQCGWEGLLRREAPAPAGEHTAQPDPIFRATQS